MNSNLTTCKSCGKEVAKSARACPSCGARVRSMRAWGVVLVIIGGLFMLSNINAILGNGEQKSVNSIQNSLPTPTVEQKGLEAYKDVFNVTVTIPAHFLGEDMTQQECDEIAEGSGYSSVTLNADGSATYIMSKAQHATLMHEIEESINNSLADMIKSDEFPNYVSVSAGKNFTEFTITTSSEEVTLAESFSVMALYVYGGMYNAFNGTPTDNISAKFVNESSGKVIEESNFRDIE